MIDYLKFGFPKLHFFSDAPNIKDFMILKVRFFFSEFPLQTQHSKLDFCMTLRTYISRHYLIINDKNNQRKVT